MTRFRNALVLVGVGAAAFGLGTGISFAQDDGSSTTTTPPAEQQSPEMGRHAFGPPPELTDEQKAQIEAWRTCMADNGVDLPEIDPANPPAEPPEKPQVDRETMHSAMEACADLRPEGMGPGLGFHFGGPGHHGPGGPGCDEDKSGSTDGTAPSEGTDTPSTDAPAAEGTAFHPLSV